MKTKPRILILAGAALALAAALTLALTRPWDRAIRIKTPLSPEAVVGRVELSSGTLHFKTETELYNELTPEDLRACSPRPAPRYITDTEVFPLREEDILQMLNIAPDKWRIPERLSFKYEHFDWNIGLSSAEAPETDEGGSLYVREYRSADQRAFLHIEAVLAGKCWLRTERELRGGEQLEHVKLLYGEQDSRIGDMPLAVLNEEYSPWDRCFDAYVVKGNTAYFLRTNGMTQQEFTELLISLYEAPEPETRDPVRFLRSLQAAE